MAGRYSAPGVYRREIDLSNILLPNGISNGGTVIRSQMGPIRRPVLVTNDKEFIETFGAPYYVSGASSATPLTPEYGYGSYGAVEFLKESSTLYVVRAYTNSGTNTTAGKQDIYAACQVKKSAMQDWAYIASAGVPPIESTVLDVFDTRDYISSYNAFADVAGNLKNPLLVGFVSPGLNGNNVAVTVETLNPLSDWLYNYDNYPIQSSATKNNIAVGNPNGFPYQNILVSQAWITSGVYNASSNPTTATGGAGEVYKHFPIASNVVKVKVYVKPENKQWTDLYANSADAKDGKIRMQPTEVFYGSMIPMQDNDGNEMFIEQQINGRSQFIYVQTNGETFCTNTGTTKEAPNASWDYTSTSALTTVNISATSGVWKLPDYSDNAGVYVVNMDSGRLQDRLVKFTGGDNHKVTGLKGDSEFWGYFNSTEEIPVSILINTSYDTDTKMAVADVVSSRKDCVATNPVGDVYQLNYQTIMEQEQYGYPAPSYMTLYAGYSKIYDKFNDKYVYLPNSIFGAAIFARVDSVAAPWFAPAGTSRATLAVLDQNKIFSTDQIGRMYDKNINSVKFVPGAGFAIWGQKTAQLKTTALDRINVRRNLIYMQINIENALNQFIFENNTQQTRLRVYSIIDEFLNNIKASDGLYSYEVICDTTNNPPSVIDANQLNVDVYVQPTKAIEFIQFTTVITRTGVNFGDVKLKYA